MFRNKILVFFCFLFLSIPFLTQAYAVRSGDSINLASNEVAEDNLYAAGVNVVIDGNVQGDLVVIGKLINVNGNISGDIICAGDNITINGNVEGSVRCAGDNIMINGHVERNVMLFSALSVVGPKALLAGDMLVYGGQINIQGQINGDLHGGVGGVIISGKIDKNVDLDIFEGKFEIMNQAEIMGNLDYHSEVEANIGAQSMIQGDINYTVWETEDDKGFHYNWFWVLYCIFASLIVGLVVLGIWKKQIVEFSKILRAQTLEAVLWGFGLLIVFPVIFFLLLISMIGIPLALILTGVLLILIYISSILTGIWIGREAVKRFLPDRYNKRHISILEMVIGIVILKFLISIPILGCIIWAVAVCLGLGSLVIMVRERR